MLEIINISRCVCRSDAIREGPYRLTGVAAGC